MLNFIMCLVAICFFQEQVSRAIPHLKDETSVLKIKAHPEEIFDEPVILCGAVGISDYFNYGYEDAAPTHYSLVFREVGNTDSDLSSEPVYLYLKKTPKTREIVDGILSIVEKRKPRNQLLLSRVRVHLHPGRYMDGNKWDLLELTDIQFVEDDRKGWKAWHFEKERLAAEAAAKKEKDLVLSTQKRVEEEKIAKKKLDAEIAAEFEKKQWREWTLKSGTKIEARYGGVVSGELKLITRKDETYKIPTGDLTADEKEWIKEKPWINPDATKPKKPSPRKPQTKRDKSNSD